jgi:hypothetical protein
MDLKKQILKAAKADSIPEGTSGLWIVKKVVIKKALKQNRNGVYTWIIPGTYTHLIRITMAKLNQWPPGEVVMEDTSFELHKHLNFMLRSHGQVLVTGLGLGCVVRGCLANPNVRHITCIEKNQNVLNLVEPYMPTNNLTIIKADALEWCKDNKKHFDCAWHDLWTNRENGEPHLTAWHIRLLFYCKKNVNFQGAWNSPRWIIRKLSI